VISAPINQQAPGSLTTTYAGNIYASVGSSNIQFTGSSLMIANPNGTWQPAPGGVAGNAVANYGGVSTARVGFFTVTAYAALRNVILDVASSVVPINNNSFSNSNLLFSFVTNYNGAIDYLDNFGDAGTALLDGSLANNTTANATLALTNGLQKLVIPISCSYLVTTSSALNGTTLFLNGQIVALENPAPVITSFVVSNQTFRLTATNANLTSQVLRSVDLKNWSSVTTTAASQSGQIIFTAPISGSIGFFRLQK
jgi:hypothetical protein